MIGFATQIKGVTAHNCRLQLQSSLQVAELPGFAPLDAMMARRNRATSASTR
jgi:hypothetical protein